MSNTSILRGMATVSFFADDVVAARDWYADLFGIDAYFQQPDTSNPAYVEFRIGDYLHEFGIVDRRYAPTAGCTEPAGLVLFWHVDDVEHTLAHLVAKGARAHDPVTDRGHGFVTASVVDPFGNILGIMYNPHYLTTRDAFRRGVHPLDETSS